MSYTVIARKYRPQQFSQLLYQEHISNTLMNAIRNERIAHAYLFSGPRGVGKTSLARIFAKSLNCQQGPTAEPCGSCTSCEQITSGNSMDVIEIDGASNNSVDNIRELRENVRFSPISSKYKIYIIDEVHMLSGSAFNALLKTLEEPPAHVIFILATTEIHKIPATILSRCQKFTFRRIPREVMQDALAHIAEAEGFHIDEESLFWIARQSGGSMRDAQSVLEQVLAYSNDEKGDSISLQQVQDLLGLVSLDVYMEILNSLAERDVLSILQMVQKNYLSGVDTGRFLQGMMEFLRVLSLAASGIREESLLQFPRNEIPALMELSKKFTVEEINVIYQEFRSLLTDLRYFDDDKILLEMSFMRVLDILQQPRLASLLHGLARSLGYEDGQTQLSYEINDGDIPSLPTKSGSGSVYFPGKKKEAMAESLPASGEKKDSPSSAQSPKKSEQTSSEDEINEKNKKIEDNKTFYESGNAGEKEETLFDQAKSLFEATEISPEEIEKARRYEHYSKG